ncbi:MAG: UDP-N-acetylmuramoyl-tripeptide--D-alanyl-D-alanine ligase [Candidatus Omnitrophica bacterium]|nr:UDP-N-acetylmuramoyl-tripeptide--D-alanyl-D-alanine ligase [Candidatus Omnitrophota bacterium]
MYKFSIEEIAEITGGKLFSRNKEEKITTGFSIDSRTIKSGQFFIAIKGDNYDGHDFVSRAVQKNASGVIVDHADGELLRQNQASVIVVKDATKAMCDIASAIRKGSKIPFICVTGTNGKTTVKNILADILSVKYRVLKSPASYNNVIGLSLTLFRLVDDFDIAVIELGTNAPGEISTLSGIAAPNAAVITNIGCGHLNGLSDKRGVFNEKRKLLDFLPVGGKAFLNKDDVLLGSVRSKKISVSFFGTDEQSDEVIEKIREKNDGYEFYLSGKKYYLPVAGAHNVYNASAAILAAESFGIGYDLACGALLGTRLPKMRLEKMVFGNCNFINDSYNANPDSFECALRFLKSVSSKKKGVVAGGMSELGIRSGFFHREVGKSIAKKNIDFLVVVGTSAREIALAAEGAGMDPGKIICAEDAENAGKIVNEMSDADTTVLVKGSRVSKMEEVIKCYTTFYTN